MALTTCIDCRGEVSHRASRCPHCDCPRPTARQRRIDRMWITGIVVILSLMMLKAFPAFLEFFTQFS